MGWLGDPALAPLAAWTDAALLIARLIVGVLMLYYGWPKLRDPAKNARDFDGNGFKPGRAPTMSVDWSGKCIDFP